MWTHPLAGCWGSCSSECCSPQWVVCCPCMQTAGSWRPTWTGCVPSWRLSWSRSWQCCLCTPWNGLPGRLWSALGFSCRALSPSPAPTRWSCRPRPGLEAPPLAALWPAGSTRRWSSASPAPHWTPPAAAWVSWKAGGSLFELGSDLGLVSRLCSG